MPTDEEQRILDRINSDVRDLRAVMFGSTHQTWGAVVPPPRMSNTERAGYTGAALGAIASALVFILIFIPIAQQEAVLEYRETAGQCEANTGSVRPIP